MSVLGESVGRATIREEIFADIQRGDNLLSLPASLAKVIEVINDENASIDTLASAINKDPSLTATIIRMANTPYYGRMSRCSSLSEAVAMLGSLTVKSVALTATALNPKNIQEQCGISPEEFVANSITVAMMAREIAVAVGYSKHEDALTAGLLHDIGVLYFMGNHTELYKDAVSRASESVSLTSSEDSVFGINHMKVGEALAERWHLPKSITASISQHHVPFGGSGADVRTVSGEGDERLMLIIRLATVMAGESYLPSHRNMESDLESVNLLIKKLGIDQEALSRLVGEVFGQSLNVSAALGLSDPSIEGLMTLANKKLGQYLNSLQRMMREREELNTKILVEERRKGVAESRIAIMATLSHHINNSAMVAMGVAEALSLTLKPELSKETYSEASSSLKTIVDSVENIKLTLAEMSHVADNDIMAVHDKDATIELDALIIQSKKMNL